MNQISDQGGEPGRDPLPSTIIKRLEACEQRLTGDLQELRELKELLLKHTPGNTQASGGPEIVADAIKEIDEVLARSAKATTSEDWQALSKSLGEITSRLEPRWKLRGPILPAHLIVDSKMDSAVKGLNFSPDSESLQGVTRDGKSWQFSLTSAQPGKTTRFSVEYALEARVEISAFSSDGSKFACTRPGRFEVQLYPFTGDPAEKPLTPQTISTGDSRLISSICFSPNGTKLAFLDDFGRGGLHVASLAGEDPKIIGYQPPPFSRFQAAALAFSPDGERLLVAWNGTGSEVESILDLVSLKNIEGRNGLPRLIDRKKFPGHVGGVAFGHDNELIASVENFLFIAQPIAARDAREQYNWQMAFTSNARINLVTVSPTRDLIAFSDDRDFMRIADLRESWEGSELEIIAYRDCSTGSNINFEGNSLSTISFSPCGKRLALGYRNGNLQVVEGRAV